MIRCVKILALCAIFQALVPAPAHAISLWWLDELSGPGFFLGADQEFRLVCFGGPSQPPVTGVAGAANQEKPVDLTAAFKTECLTGRRDQRHLFSINPSIAYAVASNNSLPYDDARANRRVELLTMAVALSYVVPGGRGTELRLRVEWNQFFGGAFDAFSRGSITPAIDLKPFRWHVRDDNPGWSDVLAIRIGAAYFPKGFDASDFGALKGSFHTDHELLTSIDLVLDFAKLPR